MTFLSRLGNEAVGTVGADEVQVKMLFAPITPNDIQAVSVYIIFILGELMLEAYQNRLLDPLCPSHSLLLVVPRELAK